MLEAIFWLPWLVPPLLGALIVTFTALVALTLGVSPDRRDRRLGFVFLLGSSGTILLGTRIVQEIQDVQTLLFGTAVAVVPGDFKLLVGIAVVIGALHLAGWRGFVAVVFDSEDARVRGLPTRAIELILLMTIALAVSVTLSAPPSPVPLSITISASPSSPFGWRPRWRPWWRSRQDV